MLHQKKQITTLEREVETLKQESRNKTIVINGLKEDKEKDPSDQIMTLCKDKLNVNLHPHDIDTSFIVPSRKDPRQKSIYITLTTGRKKVEIMKVKKNLRNIPGERIYINEHLTLKQGEIFAKARELVRKKKITAAWTRDGKVFIKTEERGQPKLIMDTEQLDLDN